MTPSLFQRRLLPLILAAGLALSPALAQAKAGSGSSMGSLGSHTFTHNPSAQPIQRSVTPPPKMNAPPPPPSVQSESLSPPPQARPAPMQAPPTANPGFFQRHPFVGGLMGGIVGAGIGSMLFGGGHFFGEGFGGFLGFALQLALIFFLVRLAIGFFRRRPPSSGGYGAPSYQEPHMGYQEPHMGLAAPTPMAAPITANPIEFPLGEADLNAFGGLLAGIQAAWSNGDVAALQQMMTPEMAGYLAEQIGDHRAQGIENKVEQVRLLKGDVLQTWREGPTEYASVNMCWSAIDYTIRIGSNQVVEGNPRTPTETAEVWTLLRRPGTPWLLTAIQQVN